MFFILGTYIILSYLGEKISKKSRQFFYSRRNKEKPQITQGRIGARRDFLIYRGNCACLLPNRLISVMDVDIFVRNNVAAVVRDEINVTGDEINVDNAVVSY